MKIKAITPLGTFKSIELTEKELDNILNILHNSSRVDHIQLPTSKDKKQGIILPCEIVKNSVFEIDIN